MANEKQKSTRLKRRIADKVDVARQKKRTLAPNRPVLLVTVVNRNKAEFFVDLLQSFEANVQLDVSAFGTAPQKYMLVSADSEKQVIFSIIRQENARKALDALQDKFNSLRGGKGIAYTVPISGTIGVAVYQFLTNMM